MLDFIHDFKIVEITTIIINIFLVYFTYRNVKVIKNIYNSQNRQEKNRLKPYLNVCECYFVEDKNIYIYFEFRENKAMHISIPYQKNDMYEILEKNILSLDTDDSFDTKINCKMYNKNIEIEQIKNKIDIYFEDTIGNKYFGQIPFKKGVVPVKECK